MPKLNRTVQKAQGMLNQMSNQEQQNAQQLNNLQQKEETATQQIQQMNGMLSQLSNSSTSANYEFGSEIGTTGQASTVSTAGLANSGAGLTATAGLASDAAIQPVQSFYQGGLTK